MSRKNPRCVGNAISLVQNYVPTHKWQKHVQWIWFTEQVSGKPWKTPWKPDIYWKISWFPVKNSCSTNENSQGELIQPGSCPGPKPPPGGYVQQGSRWYSPCHIDDFGTSNIRCCCMESWGIGGDNSYFLVFYHPYTPFKKKQQRNLDLESRANWRQQCVTGMFWPFTNKNNENWR